MSLLRTIDAFLDAETYERGLAPLTIEAYRRDLITLSEFVSKFGVARWADVTIKHLTDFLTDFQNRGFAPASLERYTATIKTYFAWLIGENLIERSPADGLFPARKAKRLPRVVEEAPLNELIDAVNGTTLPDLRDRAMLELLYGCGLRCCECIALALQDIDFVSKHLRIHGKGNKERQVPFGPPAAKALRAYLAARSKWLDEYKRGALAADCNQLSAPVFLTPRGKALRRPFIAEVVHQRIHAHLDPSAICTPHTLRHSYGTHLLQHHAGVLHIRDLLGHASVATTQIYTEVDSSHLKSTFDKCFPRS